MRTKFHTFIIIFNHITTFIVTGTIVLRVLFKTGAHLQEKEDDFCYSQTFY